MRALIVVIAVLLLTSAANGCTTARVACPSPAITQWSKAESATLADELVAICPVYPAACRALKECWVLRKEIASCAK